MLDAAALAAALRVALPSATPAQITPLVLALVTATFDAAGAERQLTDANLAPLLQQLVARGQPIVAGDAALSFQGNDQRGATITISGDVAGGDMIKGPLFTLTVPNVSQPTSQYIQGSHNIQASDGSNVTVYYGEPPVVPAPPRTDTSVDKEQASRLRQLERYRNNLQLLEEQAATYGGELYAPLALKNQIDEQREQIADLMRTLGH